jgi:hypothetical protein
VQGDTLASNFFDIKPSSTPQPEKKEEVKTEVVTQPEPPKVEEKKEEEDEYDLMDIPVWLKQTFDTDDIESIKNERAEYRKLKEQPQQPEFSNDSSKLMYEYLRQGKTKELLEFLDGQDKITKYTSGGVTEDNAMDIIKLGMQLQNKLLTQDEIDFQYRQQYSFPKEPKQSIDQTDEDFAAIMDEYKQKIANVKMSRNIAAKMAMPQLEKLKSEIVLPDIFKQVVQQKQPTQEELDAAKKYDDAFLNSVDASISKFSGVSVPVKNEVVDYTVTYGTNDDEKKALASTIKNLASVGYDSNSLFAPLWVNEDKKTLNTEKMINDYYFLKNRETILNKVALESANKAIENYVKGKKNINIKDTQTNPVIDNDEPKSIEDKAREDMFGKL